MGPGDIYFNQNKEEKRMNVSYEGIGYLAVTIPASTCTAGHVCRVNAAGLCEQCSSGDHFDGVTDAVENQRATMQIQGCAEIRYSGTKPSAGRVKLSSDGKGGVKLDTNGKEYLIMQVKEETTTIVVKL